MKPSLLRSVAILLMTAMTGGAAAADSATRTNTTPNVVFYGATPRGIAAAVAASREGASVFLLEPSRHVGGLHNEMQAWVADVFKRRPGTWTVRGRVTQNSGKGVPGVRVQCGTWHWSVTDAEGRYQIPGVTPGRRVLVTQQTGLRLQPRQQGIVLEESDVEAKPFLAELEKAGNRW
jgi:hypothetical protein